MDEPLDPIRPKPSAPSYLPRLWKSPPDPDEEIAAAAAKKKREDEAAVEARQEQPRRKKKKKAEPKSVDGTGAVKLEKTPVLDTVEARQRARWAIGGLLTAIGAIALIIILQAIRGNGEEEENTEGEPPPVVITPQPRPNLEFEARAILNNAKLSAEKGKGKVALDLLIKVAKNYQGTAASREAVQAIDRNRHRLPLFGNESVDLASQPKSSKSSLPMPTGPTPPPSPTPPPTPTPPSVAPAPSTVAVAAVPPPSSTAGPTAPEVAAPQSIPAPIALKPLPRGFQPKAGAAVHPSGWPTRILCNQDGAEMVLVPGGTFLMGREDGDPAERPAHLVAVSTYYIDQHEVTVGQFVRFLKETGRPINTARLIAGEAKDLNLADDLPVVNVSAREAKAYCNWADRKLPTEAQWEMAARSTDGSISYWNGELPRKDPPRGPRTMEPVMSLASDASPFGVFDLAANAWEWTSEYYDSKYFRQFRSLATDPTGPRESPVKIAQVTVKGGSKSGILTWRDGLKSETRLPYLGFRGALSVEGAPSRPPTAPATNSNPALPSGVQPF